MSQVVILQDSREKLPLLFPTHLLLHPTLPANSPQSSNYNPPQTIRLQVVKTHLLTGDYTTGEKQPHPVEGATVERLLLEGKRDQVIIERKRGLDEIANNCLIPHRRALFEDELKRLRAGWKHPILFMEGDHALYLTPTQYNPEPWRGLDAFLSLVVAYDIPVHLLRMNTVAHRRASGEWAARLLLQGAKIND